MSCNASGTCTTGGAGGGSGGGSGGSGGAGSCSPSNCLSGCCNGNNCIPINAEDSTTCGMGAAMPGVTCTRCSSSQTCTNGGCVTSTTTLKYGDPCTQDSDCMALGGTFKCKKMTTSGNATYTDG